MSTLHPRKKLPELEYFFFQIFPFHVYFSVDAHVFTMQISQICRFLFNEFTLKQGI